MPYVNVHDPRSPTHIHTSLHHTRTQTHKRPLYMLYLYDAFNIALFAICSFPIFPPFHFHSSTAMHCPIYHLSTRKSPHGLTAVPTREPVKRATYSLLLLPTATDFVLAGVNWLTLIPRAIHPAWLGICPPAHLGTGPPRPTST